MDETREDLDMTYLRYVCVALAAALVAAYSTLWVLNPTPLEQQHTVTPPILTVKHQDSDLLLLGRWEPIVGDDRGAANATEIRCFRAVLRCVEAYALFAHSDAGDDLDALVFIYQVDEWSDGRLVATAGRAMNQCLDRVLSVDLLDKSVTLKWSPGSDECEGDVGEAVLMGDPV